jgi:hypothetical protein
MDKYYVLIAGKGTTSRANLEALMEDHYYANGPDGTLVLAYKDKPSQGQVFATQLAKDKSKDILVFTTESGKFDGISQASVNISDNPIKSAVAHLKGSKAVTFLLWSDEDSDCQNTLSACKDAEVPCYDLTEGLIPLNPSATITEAVEPKMPKQELNKPAYEEDADGEEEEDEEDDEDEEEADEEEDDMDNLYFGIQALAKIFARAIVEELEKGKESQ